MVDELKREKEEIEEQVEVGEEQVEVEKAAFEEAAATAGVPYKELSEFIAKATRYGLYPIVAYGLDFNSPDEIYIATSPIPDLPISLDLVDRTAQIKLRRSHLPGSYIPINLLSTIVEKNRIMSPHGPKQIRGLDTRNVEHRKVIARLIAFCTASRWANRAFVLVDIVGFSQATTAEQLALRMSLGQSINQVCYRMQSLSQLNLLLEPNFNRLSTGDGFYFFNWSNKPESQVTSFVFMLLLMAQTEALFLRTKLRLRAAFAIGEAYTFPYRGPGLFPGMGVEATFIPDAIGPVLNDLQRVLTAACPGQILVRHFDQPGRAERMNERLDIETMLTRIRSEILPRELDVTDPIKSQDIILERIPTSPLRVIDKNKQVHHCYNVWGRIPMKSDEGTCLQAIGLICDDDSKNVRRTNFRNPDSL
jgi:hypothetical protein